MAISLAKAQKPRLIIPIGHTGSVKSVAYSRDGRYVVSGSEDGTVKLWLVSTGQLLHTLQVSTDILKGPIEVKSVAFSPDGKYLASTFYDKIKLWEVSTGKLVQTLGGHSIFAYSLAFSPNGQYLASGTSDKTIMLWEIPKGKLVQTLKEHPGVKGYSGVVNTITYSADGKYLASGASDGTVKLWNVNDGNLLKNLCQLNNEITSVAYSPDGQYLASGSGDNTVRVWDTRTGQVLNTLQGHNDRVTSIAYSRNGRYVVSGSWDGTVKLWQVGIGKLVNSLNGHHDKVNSVAFSPDGEHVASGSMDKTVQIWNTSIKQLGQILQGRTRTVHSVSYSPNGQYLASGSDDGIVRIWQTSTGQMVRTLRMPNRYNSGLLSLAYSPDGQYIASSNWDFDIQLWETGTGKLVATLKGIFNLAAFSPDGKYLAAGSISNQSGIVSLWEANMELWKANIEPLVYANIGHTQAINSLAFSPDGQYLASGSGDNTVRIWNTGTGQVVDTLQGYTGSAYSAVYSPPDGKYIALGVNQDIWVWQTSTSQWVQTFKGKNNFITSIAYSPDGQYLVSGSWDGTVKLWQANKGDVVQTLNGHTNSIKSVCYSPDGRYIVSSSADNTLKLWSVSAGKEVATIIPVDSTDYLIQTPAQYFKGSHQAAKLLHYVTPELNTISFEQLDVRYNRPDLVLQALGSPDTSLVKAYHQAYLKRIKRLGIDTTAFGNDLAVPQADFANRDKISYEQTQQKLTLHITGKDSTHVVDRFNVWVNEVPLFGSKGIGLKHRNKKTLDTTLTIPLSEGANSIETSVINSNGIESYRLPLVVNYTPAKPATPKLYFVGLGVSSFKDSTQNLSWSVKDIRDLAKAFKNKHGGAVEVDTLFNQELTLARVKALKHKLLQTSLKDKVIVAYSGHGLLSDSLDYFLSTYQTDFDKPQQGGLPYEVLESLLDSIPARQKLLLLDACHSGEVDKEELARLAQQQLDSTKVLVGQQAPAGKEGKGVKQKGTRLAVSARRRVGMRSSFELMQELFVNVARSTGATVISAAGGTQYALEGGSLENGVFTYSILEYVQGHPTCKVSELRQYVNKRVSERTGGMQVPTARTETLLHDWNIW